MDPLGLSADFFNITRLYVGNGGMAEWLERRTQIAVSPCNVGSNPALLESFSARLSGYASNVSSCDLLVDDRHLLRSVVAPSGGSHYKQCLELTQVDTL